MALGAAVGWQWPSLSAWWMLGAAALCGAASFVLSRRVHRYASVALLAVGVALFGASWSIARHFAVPTDDLARYADDDYVLARLRGVVASSPEVRHPAGGSLAAFNYQSPWLVFALEAKALVDRHGNTTDVSGMVWVRAPHDSPWLMPGDVVELMGSLRAPPRPQNPGQFDIWRFARLHGQSATMSVSNSSLINVMLTSPTTQLWITRWRDALRNKASAWLYADMPEVSAQSHHRAVLQAILIGERAPELHEVGAAMQRTGLAHLMAISGLHLGILVGLVLLVLGAAREPKRWHGVAAIVLIAVYLLLVEVRVPVLRAGVMLSAASLGIVLKRRVAIGGLISVSLMTMLLISPGEVASAGFQLSFGVVYALIYLAAPLRERWFGRANMIVGPSRAMLFEACKSSLVVACVAWLVATPIVLFHFGIVSPLGVPLSLVGVPAAGAVLALGYLKMLLSAVLPSAGLLIGVALAWITDALIAVVLWIDKLPGASISLPMPGAVWTALATTWTVAIVLVRERPWTRWLWFGGAGLVVWLVLPMVWVRGEPALRVDMLAVGDGSCYLIRTGGEVIVFDAGSLGDSGVGARIVVPALRALGVRSVDTFIVSHANLDHFSAMLEIVDSFGGDEIIVTPQFLRDAADESKPSAALLAGMRESGVAVTNVSRGESRTIGESTLTWIHPPADAEFEAVNDSAMVIRIECAGRSLLLCGDIQADAIAMIDASEELRELHADVMELPHHGSFRDEAVAFVEAIDAAVVLQSTGSGRMRRDRWKSVLDGVDRLITARDGACWVEFHAGGGMTFGKLGDNPAQPE